MKRIIYFLILLLITIGLLEIAGYIGMGLISKDQNESVFANREYFRIRKILINATAPTDFPAFIPHVELHYEAAPFKEEFGFRQHNFMGFRGPAVPLKKPEETYRILFLGGSTTYGTGVNNPDSTYPALVGHILNAYLDSLPEKKRYKNVDIINAGLPALTSAEELTHYLFKYSYFKPNLVVLHTGINDALKGADNLYQPDYGNTFFDGDVNILPLPVKIQFIMRSYFLSFMVINLVYYDVIHSPNSYRKMCVWFYPNLQDTIKPTWQKSMTAFATDLTKDSSIYRNIPHPAFEKNTETLIRTIIADSVSILIIPNALNPTYNYPYPFAPYFVKIFVRIAQENVNILKKLSLKYSVPILPFDYGSIPSQYYLDNCHLNASGERAKGILVADCIKTYLSNKVEHINTGCKKRSHQLHQ